MDLRSTGNVKVGIGLAIERAPTGELVVLEILPGSPALNSHSLRFAQTTEPAGWRLRNMGRRHRYPRVGFRESNRVVERNAGNRGNFGDSAWKGCETAAICNAATAHGTPSTNVGCASNPASRTLRLRIPRFKAGGETTIDFRAPKTQPGQNDGLRCCYIELCTDRDMTCHFNWVDIQVPDTLPPPSAQRPIFPSSGTPPPALFSPAPIPKQSQFFSPAKQPQLFSPAPEPEPQI
eukprot:2293809-Rhodomonas_salina.1